MEKKNSGAPNRTKRIIFWLILIAIPLSVPLCGLELALRIKDPRGRAQLTMLLGLRVESNYIDDPALGHRPRDELYYWDDKANPPSERKPDSTTRIFALGDSFVKAHRDIGLENSFYRVAGGLVGENNTRTDYEWFHFGVSGYCERQHLELLRRYGPQYAPDIIIVQVYLGNDVGENADLLVQQLQHRNDRIRIWNYYRIPDQQASEEASSSTGIGQAINRHSYAARFLVDRFRTIGWKMRGIPKSSIIMTNTTNFHILDLMAKETPYYIEDAWSVTEDLVGRIKAQAESLNARLMFVLVPKEFQVNKVVAEDTAESFKVDLAEYDMDQPSRRFGEILAGEQVDYLDLTPVFREAIGKGEVLYHGHFNKEGHNLVGAMIAESLIEKGWLQ